MPIGYFLSAIHQKLFSNAKVILDPYVNKLEINTPEGIETDYQIRFGTIIINDK